MGCDLIVISPVRYLLVIRYLKLKRTQPIGCIRTCQTPERSSFSDGDTSTREVVTMHKSATGEESDKLRKDRTVREFVVLAEVLSQL